MADAIDVFESVKSDISRIAQFLVSQQLIINGHNVDYFTSNLWETCLSQGIRDDLDKLTETEIAALPSLCVQWIDKPEEHLIGILERCPNLLSLFTDIRENHLKCLRYVMRSEYIQGLDDDRILTAFMMSPKKAYEVGVMSQAVYDLVQKTKAKKVVDVGSGKGYLSQYLSLRYGVNVMGIDSSDSNTKNAEKRNQKILKVWRFLLKKANGKILDSGMEEKDHLEKDDVSCKPALVNKAEHCFESSEPKYSLSDTGTCLCRAMACECSGGKNINNTINNYNTDRCQQSSVNDTNHLENKGKNFNKSTVEDSNNAKCCCSRTSMEEVSNFSLKDSILNNVKSSSMCEHHSSRSSQHSSYQPVTAFVSADAKIVQDLGTLFDEDGKEGLVLVGLHTCGDLAPTAIKIFLNDSCVKALCLVGCCYHLLSQPSVGDTCTEINQENEVAEETEYGFPVSDYLRQQNIRLSRNATMVAQQAADRIAYVCKIPSRSIFYRAVLQVILKEKLGLNTMGMHVGRIGAKCKTFTEYVSKSFKKLGLASDMVTPEDLENYLKRFESQERQLMAFHQLRACIAPCIESLLLMDRLCYLHEQGVKDARIVALFDPVKSPRSYAIVASK